MMGLFSSLLSSSCGTAPGGTPTLEELITVGERRIYLLRAFNAREGIGKAAGVLPKRLFEPLAGTGPTARVALDAGEFARATIALAAATPPRGTRRAPGSAPSGSGGSPARSPRRPESKPERGRSSERHAEVV
jgi:hypothetical protein